MPVSRGWKIVHGTAVSLLVSLGGFTVYTKHVHWEDLQPSQDQLARTSYYRQFNPSLNPVLRDVAVRQLPIHKVDPELIQDAKAGGTRLVERYCAGVYGGVGMSFSPFTALRKALRVLYVPPSPFLGTSGIYLHLDLRDCPCHYRDLA